jgi:hypothetical protein
VLTDEALKEIIAMSLVLIGVACVPVYSFYGINAAVVFMYAMAAILIVAVLLRDLYELTLESCLEEDVDVQPK